MRLGECTPPNFTNSGVYRNARLLVDPDAETEDCAEYQVQCLEGNLPQSPVYRTPYVGLIGRQTPKVRGNEPAIDLFGYPASPQTAKAFRARLKTLVCFYFRDVHLLWTKESDSFKFLIEALLNQFPSACWDDGWYLKQCPVFYGEDDMNIEKWLHVVV